MEREAELALRRNFTIALGAFALGAAALLAVQGVGGAVFRTILATSVFLLSAIVALMLWEIAARTGRTLPRLLALSLAVVVAFELLNTVAALEPLAGVIIAGMPETWWRDGTWGPTTHLLPLAMVAIILLPERSRKRSVLFVSALLLVGIAMLVLFEWLPRYTSGSWLGITRPDLILAPVLWAGAGYFSWRRRARGEIHSMFALMSVIMVLANVSVLYSQSADDAPALVAHFGKAIGKLFFLVCLMEMTARQMAQRERAERELQLMNAQLEHRVRERTREVEQSNDALRGEVMRRQQAERRLQTQFDRLSLIDRITRSVAARQDISSIFQVVIGSLEDQMPVDFASIGLYDAADRAFTIAHLGVKSRPVAIAIAMPEQSRIAVDENGLARSMKGELVYEPDISRVPFAFPSRLAAGGLKALVIAPLLIENDVFGALVIARRQAESFTSTDCEFVKQLCEHVSLAAHQAQLRETLQVAYDDLRQSRQTVMQQERLRALGQMASGIAHDINNAISPMALHTQSLLETGGNLSPRIRSYLQIVSRVTDDVTATVARMREFYRERDPQMILSPVDLNQLAGEVIDLTRARWSDMPQRAGVTIEMRADLAAGLPPAQGIASEIREALTNLIFNAVDALPQGGRLTVRTGFAGSPAADRVAIEIIDTGIGMDEHTRRRCLEPFFTTKGERGTGLGLAMVYGAAQRLGAELEIESELGRGTTFRMVFAIAEMIAAAASRPAAGPASLPSLRILIIDDDPVILDSMRLVLELDGHTVTAANDGRAGVDTFRTAYTAGEAFSVVITDLGMPYMDGHEVARAIKALSAATPVILLTGWGRRMTGERELPDNVDRTLDKPPKLPELREALADTLAMAGQ
ncbi:MAG TPA: ATP-binding protein [Stellaceae bacterium]|jgi:signal transduction histidine kinase/ActR/RegA family two-component response regulator|nr:ATP-binding protein [Stellaceae bacterium]